MLSIHVSYSQVIIFLKTIRGDLQRQPFTHSMAVSLCSKNIHCDELINYYNKYDATCTGCL